MCERLRAIVTGPPSVYVSVNFAHVPFDFTTVCARVLFMRQLRTENPTVERSVPPLLQVLENPSEQVLCDFGMTFAT